MEPFYDKPEQKLFPITLNNEKRLGLHIGNCAIALFRRRPNMDYLAVLHGDDEDEAWTLIFDRHDLIYWMAGLALDVRDRDNIRKSNSKLGSFYSRYGYNPDVVIEDYPSANEFEVYINYIERGWTIPDCFPEEEEPDGG